MNGIATRRWAGTTTPALDDDDLHYFCSLIEERAGIHLKASKHELIKTRLRSRLHNLGFQDFSDYRKFLTQLQKNDPEWEIFTNLLTTNKTDFFRESKHFSFLTNTILPEWLKSKEKIFKVWSAASSTGEEAYTLAMILRRHLPSDRDFKILASDIDTEVLKIAKNAVYPISKKVEIPEDYQHDSLDLGKRELHSWFRIKSHLKEKVHFKQHNLIERTAPKGNIFDLVLCRNVLIYFDQDNIDFVQSKLFSSVKNDGYVFIGHSESLQGIKHSWQKVGPSIYRKV